MEKIKQNRYLVFIVLAIILLAIIFFATNKTEEAIVEEDNLSEVIGEVEGDVAQNTEIPMPEESSWVENEVSPNSLTLDVPTEYFVSKPRIEGCDATSISAMHAGKPVSVAFVYNVDCDHPDLKLNAARFVEKNGYIFRTNYTSPSVIAVFERLVNSAR